MLGSLFLSKRCSLPRQPPLPTLDFDETGNTKYVPSQVLYKGIFTGFNVTVQTQDAMVNLYTKGYFGKGNLSLGYPSYEKRLRRTLEALNPTETDDVPRGDTSVEEPDVISKTAAEIANPCESGENADQLLQDQSVNEELHLCLEEAFFLSYALNCLQIYDGDKLLDHSVAWSTFQKVQPNFVERYVAYHHFRAKGWVVRSGIKYGGDYVLYKDGPPFYHSTYVVFIVTSENSSINFLLACCRTVEVTKKELLVCRVKIPENCAQFTELDRLNECQVSEYTLKRWLTSENRNIAPRSDQ